jgi:hypothetical protein
MHGPTLAARDQFTRASSQQLLLKLMLQPANIANIEYASAACLCCAAVYALLLAARAWPQAHLMMRSTNHCSQSLAVCGP